MPVQHNKRKTYSFGIMCNSFMLEHWQKVSIEKLLQHGFELKLAVVNQNPATGVKPLGKLRTYPYKYLFFRLYNRYILKPTAKQKVDITGLTQGATIMRCRTRQKKYADYFFGEDLEKIRSIKLDFMLRFGFNILRGDILQSVKEGIWSFHHDDEQKYRGGPPGFWEIYHKDYANGVILQQLTESLDAGMILKKGYFKTIFHSYSGHINQLYYQSANWPLQVAKSLVQNKLKPVPSKTNAPVYHMPDNRQMIWFCFQLLWNKLFFHLRELFTIEDWNVFLAQNNSDWMTTGQIKPPIIEFPKKSKETFAADPFVFQCNSKHYLVFEDYSYRKRKGVISISQINSQNSKIEKPQLALEEDFHLAYPHVFEYQGEIYLIPESFEKKEVRLYKFNPAQLKFVYVKTLLDNIEAVDSTLVWQDPFWWLFCTKKDMPSVNLYAYYAIDLWKDFQPHHNNPVKTDIRSARPGGRIYKQGDVLFRPTQDCAETYGRRININKITKLTPDEFAEECIQKIDPLNNIKFNRGIHTLNFNEKYLVFDGKRFVFLLPNLFFQLKRKTKKLLKPDQ